MTPLRLMLAIHAAEAEGFTNFRDALVELLRRQLAQESFSAAVVNGGKR